MLNLQNTNEVFIKEFSTVMKFSTVGDSVMDRHDDVVFMIHYNGVFKYDLLRYEQFRVVEACTTDRVMFSPLLDMLVAKLKNIIWALFLCILGLDIDSSGMKLIKNDANVHGLYDLTEKHVTVLQRREEKDWALVPQLKYPTTH
ncbi:hypothetical protein Tco_0011711 [Tanacetum coccineum]